MRDRSRKDTPGSPQPVAISFSGGQHERLIKMSIDKRNTSKATYVTASKNGETNGDGEIIPFSRPRKYASDQIGELVSRPFAVCRLSVVSNHTLARQLDNYSAPLT
jgi:hypothetical protein